MDESSYCEHGGIMENKVTAIGKAVKILKAFSEEPFSYSAIELSNKLDINRTTVHRILLELENEMLIVQNNTDKYYTIGPGLFSIGSKYLYRKHNFAEIRIIIDNIALETNQNIGYTILDNGAIINLYESEVTMPVKITYRQGTYFPINCGAYGKTIMAFFKPEEEMEKIVRNTVLEKRTVNTIVDPDELIMEYEKIREQGYAISDEENLLGAYGIGVPVFNLDGSINGCIGMAVVKNSISMDSVESYIKLLKKGAKNISKYVY